MRIAIEAQRIFRKKKHGMDFVVLETIKELQKSDKDNQYFIFVASGDDPCLQSTDNMQVIELNCPSYPLWEQVALPLAIAKIKPDILHCTSNTAPIFCSTPLVLTLHDIIFLEKRDNNCGSLYQQMGWYYRRFVVPRILKRCKKIITVSNFESGRIQERLQIASDKIIAIYNGVSSHFRPIADSYDMTKKYISARDYIFFLGNTDPKKNVARTLKAYSCYLDESQEKLPLLIADMSEESVATVLKQEDIEHIKPYLSIPGYIDNRDLAYIYSGAKIFLYTSLRESFGIPLLEAMASGTPVVTSNTSSMPEIAGADGIFADPTDVNDIASKILMLESDNDLYERQVEYGLERAKRFSWRSTAENVSGLYRSLQPRIK